MKRTPVTFFPIRVPPRGCEDPKADGRSSVRKCKSSRVPSGSITLTSLAPTQSGDYS